jgi:hypothetical protein
MIKRVFKVLLVVLLLGATTMVTPAMTGGCSGNSHGTSPC